MSTHRKNLTIYLPDGRVRPEYHAWSAMKTRCYNKADADYKNYGGRGIKVCSEWLHSYETFIVAVGKRPSANYSLNRIDNNGDYTPTNCHWATAQEQADNKRSYKNNKSGITGVSQEKSTGRWKAAALRTCLYVGYDFFEACCARKSWEVRYGN